MVRRVLLRLFPESFSAAFLRVCASTVLCLGIVGVIPAGASAAGYEPVAAYSFDEGAGSTVEDITGNGHTATIHGAEWTPHGKYGGAMEFNEHEETYLAVPDSSELDLTEEFTLEAWVRPEEGRIWQPIVDKQVGNGEGDERDAWWLYAAGPEAQRPWGGTEHAAGEGHEVAATDPLAPEVWSHVALTFDGAVERLYVDGALVDSGPAEAPLETGGEIEIGGDVETGNFLFGRLDELRIYDRVLGAAEIAADMETPIQTPMQTPVAEYSFDEGEEAGATVADLSGNGNQGTIEGAERTPHGRYGSGIDFGGEPDCVTVPDSPSLQLGEEFTLEAWVRPDALFHGPIISKAAELTPSYELAIGSTGNGLVQGWAGGYDEYAETEVHSAQKLEPHVWTHLAMTYDGAYLRLYVDGHLAGSSTHAEFILESGGPLTIGCSTVEGQWFEGRIDEVRLYERALGEGELAADMEAPIQTPKSGPVAAYAFDEGEEAGESVEDVSGNGHTATIEDGVRTGGRYGGGIGFDGKGGTECVTVPDALDLRVSEEFTLEAWVRPQDGVYGDPVVVRESGGEPAFGLGLGLGSGGEETAGGFIGQGKGTEAAGGGSVGNDAWSHVATTYDGRYIRVYVDGELADTEEAPTPPLAGEGDLKIGCDGPDGQFTGRIDEVRFYGRALDQGEVAYDMEAPLQTPKATPVADWSFDEDNEETQADTSGDGHTATVEGAAWTPHGRYGGAMEFEAEKEDVLKIPASADLNFKEEFTLEAWVRPSGQTNRYAPLIDKQEGGGLGYFLYEGGSESDVPAGAADPEHEHVHAHEPLPAGTWSHVALVFVGNRTFLYVDGEEVQDGAALPVLGEEGELEIGGSTDTADYFDGRIDEVRIYNRGLNPAEVAADMGAPIQTPQQGPIAAWSFDELGEGGTVEDVTGNEHTGTVEGTTLARGKYGEALQFNGENDVVKVPNSPDFALTEGFTLESWVRPESESDEWAPILAKEMGGGEAATELAWWLYEGGHEPNVPFGGTEPTPGHRDSADAEDPLPVDAWSHVALTYDGSQVRLYVDGELVDCSPVPAGSPPVTAGEVQIGGVTEHGEYFEGRIDEVRIYNRPLSEAEIQGTKNSTIPIAITSVTTEVGSNDAFMTGTASVYGPEADYYFEYGPTKSYDAIVDGEEITGDGEEIQLEEAAVNLAPEQTYHYRLVIESPLGTFHGKDKTFTTGPRTISVQEEEEEDAPGPSAEAALTSEAQDQGQNPFFGVDWSGELVDMENQHMFARIAESGAEYVRFGVRPDEPGLRQAFAAAKANGLIAVPYIGESAPLTEDEKTFAFAKRIVEEFGPSYGNDYWEIGNEPNRPPLEHEKEVEERNLKFAKYYEEMYNHIISAGAKVSGLKFLSPGLYGFRGARKGKQGPEEFLKEFNEDIGLPNPYSAISVHPYVFEVRNPEKLKASPGYCPHPRTAAHKPVAPCDYEQVATDMEGTVKKARRANPGMQVWVTEYGFPVESHEKGIPSFGYTEQAALVKESSWRLFRRRKHLHLDHAMIYNIQDNYKFEFGKGVKWAGHSGLFDPQAQPRPSWKAFKQVVGLH